VLALPEDKLHESGHEAAPRPFVHRPAQAPCPDALSTMMALLADAAAPVAIVGGAGWGDKARDDFAQFAERVGLPVAKAFGSQDTIPPSSPVYAANPGHAPKPKLVERFRAAALLLVVGAPLGEATPDAYALVTPAHPGQ